MLIAGAGWGRVKHVLIGLIEFSELVNLLHQAICIEITVLHQAHAQFLSFGSGCNAVNHSAKAADTSI